MSRISCLLLTTIVLLGCSSSLVAQDIKNLPSRSILLLQQYEARVLSLGQATSALGNKSGYSTNPAVPYSDSLVHLSGYIPKPTASSLFDFHFPIQTFGTAIQLKKHTISISYDNIGYTQPESFDQQFEFASSIFRLQYGTQISPSFYVGGGVAIHSNFTKYNISTNPSEITYSNIGLSAGLYHKKSFSLAGISVNQEIGLVLNDVGDENNTKTKNVHPSSFEATYSTYLPTTLRASLGWNTHSSQRKFGKSLWQAGVYLGAVKYFTRTFDQSTGFDAIFNNWGNFTYLTGQGKVTVPASEQISNNFGIELTLLEVLSFRYGRNGGNSSSESPEFRDQGFGISNADLFVRRQRGFGVGLDLQYISFSYSKVTFIPTEFWAVDFDLNYFQTTLRIPLYREKALSMKDFFRI